MGFALTILLGLSRIIMPLESAKGAGMMPEIERLDAIRIQHAQELLGPSYKSSLARRAERIDNLSDFIESATLKITRSKMTEEEARRLARVILKEAVRYEMDPLFIFALIQHESRFNPRARGAHGEIGLTQIKPKTAEWVASKIGVPWRGDDSLLDAQVNIRLGLGYLQILRNRYDQHGRLYVSAYNLGPKRLQALLDEQQLPSTYVMAVMKRYDDVYSDWIRQQMLRRQVTITFVRAELFSDHSQL